MIRLKYALEITGISQGELARRIGMTQPTIHFIAKTGSTNLETAIMISKELGYSLDWLCGLDDDNKYDKKRMDKMKERLHKLIDEM